MPPALIEGKPKKIVFNDEGDAVEPAAVEPPKKKKKKAKKTAATEEDVQVKDEIDDVAVEDDYGEDDYFAKRDKMRGGKKGKNEGEKLWFNVFPQYPVTDEVLDIKEKEQVELFNLCKSSFQSELSNTFAKRNPTDTRWLQTALHKGTAKDRANAGALLVTSNPLANLEALTTLITFTKPTNKSCTDVINILAELWKEVLLPPHRKLLSTQMRGSDWKLVRKDNTLTKEQQKRIYAYWHFENELKELYFEYVKNLQLCMQTGQENAKSTAIVTSSQLLAFAPEKEQMLLTMLVNKLGDPLPRIASKALHHLTDVAHKHPNMCGVIVKEAEKLLFRNNISDRAQHFALCFLSSIAPAGRPEVCTKLVNICFSLFKMLVQKGAINNHTMQAILRCLQKAIVEAKPVDGSTEILDKEMQDTIYRLVHLADIRISVQTLGLLLQLITVNTDKSDRFYNALYKKLFCIELVNVGTKTASQLLHIVHRAIHIDANVQRALAFIKRLLQIALHMPANMAAGCLIVINKLLRTRKELRNTKSNNVTVEQTDLSKFDSDGEEKYEDVIEGDELTTSNGQVVMETDVKQNEIESTAATSSSWHHVHVKEPVEEDDKVDSVPVKVRDMAATKYDPYYRVPAYAGAEFALLTELELLRQHFHPTIQLFADNILNNRPIDYYGDPLRDFGLPHFLERFAFKNPKKLDNTKADKPAVAQRSYIAYGARGKPVNTLTATTCTEDEMYIFNFLERKRQQAIVNTAKKSQNDEADETEDGLKPGEVDDDEFETYLDGFFSKKNQKAEAEDEDEEELDFHKALAGELKNEVKDKKEKKKKVSQRDMDDDEDDIDDIDADWGDDDDGQFDGDDVSDDEMNSIDGEEDDDGSISLDAEDSNVDSDMESGGDDDLDDNHESGDEDMPRKSRKDTALDGRNFAKKLKQSTDMKSLFAAADDFAELLEETGKTKGQGTANAVFNKDKSSDKQLKWEEKRRSNAKTYMKRGGHKSRFTGSGGGGIAKKRKSWKK